MTPFTPTVYATRIQMPISLWQQHFTYAQHSIDILVSVATFLFDTVDGFIDTLVDAAGRGVAVRLLVSDPEGANMTLRGEEEGIGDAVSARSRTTIELLARQPATAELQIRTHQTTLYTSIFRVDDEMIAISTSMAHPRIYGRSGSGF